MEASSSSAAAAVAANTPRDSITAMQMAITDMAGIYTSALGNLQNEAEQLMQPLPPKQSAKRSKQVADSLGLKVEDYAAQVLKAHREFERLASELQQSHRPEAEQLHELKELQAQHEAITEQLRSETATADAVHERIRTQFKSQLDALLEAKQRAAFERSPDGPGGPIVAEEDYGVLYPPTR